MDASGLHWSRAIGKGPGSGLLESGLGLAGAHQGHQGLAQGLNMAGVVLPARGFAAQAPAAGGVAQRANGVAAAWAEGAWGVDAGRHQEALGFAPLLGGLSHLCQAAANKGAFVRPTVRPLVAVSKASSS